MDISTGFGIIAMVQKHIIIQLYVLNHNLDSIEIISYNHKNVMAFNEIRYSQAYSFLSNQCESKINYT